MARGPLYSAAGGDKTLDLWLALSGADEAIVPYAAATQGDNFDTDLPLLLVTLKQDGTRDYAYPRMQDLVLDSVQLYTWVGGIKTVALTSGTGPLDLSKPFQPFGASPVRGSSLVVGCKEIFQKHLEWVSLQLQWQVDPVVYSVSMPNVLADVLQAGSWTPSGGAGASAPRLRLRRETSHARWCS